MGDASTIGERLRRIRRERMMTQEQLADASGISRDLISMLERATRSSARLGTITALANALDVEISELVDRRDHLQGDRDGGSVLAIRDALLHPDLLPGIDAEHDEPAPLDQLQEHVDAGWRRYWAGAFGEVTALLPRLIGEARTTHAALGAPAVQPLALTYELASGLMTQIGRTDLGAIAAERAAATPDALSSTSGPPRGPGRRCRQPRPTRARLNSPAHHEPSIESTFAPCVFGPRSPRGRAGAADHVDPIGAGGDPRGGPSYCAARATAASKPLAHLRRSGRRPETAPRPPFAAEPESVFPCARSGRRDGTRPLRN